MVLSLIYRTAGAWGAGKGSKLTPAEVDENFYDIQQAVNELEENPVQPDEIEEITVDGDQMTFHFESGATLGPVTIPVAALNYRGAWEAETDYETADLFTAQDPTTLSTGLYYVNRDFTSGLSFVPDFGTGIGGSLPYASFIMPIPDKVRIGWFWPAKPGFGLPTNDAMFAYLVADQFYILAGAPLSIAKMLTVPNFDTSYVIKLNDIEIGSLAFLEAEADGTFTFATDQQFEAGDILTMHGPDEVDDTARGLTVTLVGTQGLIPEVPS